MWMEAYKAEFIEFMVRAGALRFGEFKTKSGRLSPFFINAGAYDTGRELAALGGFYARAIVERFGAGGGELPFDCLFGPAYKGIPLVVTTAIALAREHGIDLPVSFNRKQAKDHGEGGRLVGYVPKDGDRVLIVEDVTTAGTSIRETAEILGAIAEVKLAGLIVSVNRQERGPGGRSALAELAEEFGLAIEAIVTLDEIVGYLSAKAVGGERVIDEAMLGKIEAYRREYGADG